MQQMHMHLMHLIEHMVPILSSDWKARCSAPTLTQTFVSSCCGIKASAAINCRRKNFQNRLCGGGAPLPLPASLFAHDWVHNHRTLKAGTICIDDKSTSLIGRSGSSAFQAIHHFSVDVACELVLLFGLGAKALSVWDSRTRRNNLLVGLTVR